MSPITMSSLRLDKGETVNYLREQLMRMAEMRPAEYYLDIITKPNNMAEAIAAASEFYKLANELIPGLTNDKIFIGITCNDKDRPAMVLGTYKYRNEMQEFIDLNPNRERHWFEKEGE